MTRRIALTLIVLLIGVAAIAGPAVAGRERVVRVRYVGGLNPTCVANPFYSFGIRLPDVPSTSPSLGGVCLALEGDEESMAIAITDDVTPAVEGSYAFFDELGDYRGFGAFCGRTRKPVPVPRDARTLQITAGAQYVGIEECPPNFGASVAGTIDVSFSLHSSKPGFEPTEPIRDCTEFIPAAAGARALTDDGEEVVLDVLVLLDGVPERRGRAIFERASVPYSIFGIALTPVFRSAQFSGTDADRLLEQARAAVGGTVPEPFDVVYALTAKDINGDATLASRTALGGSGIGTRRSLLGRTATMSMPIR